MTTYNENHYGRWLTKSELGTASGPAYQQLSAFKTTKNQLLCRRCGETVSPEGQLPDGRFYCRHCLVMGRLVSEDCLYHLPRKAFVAQSYLVWQGELTPYQREVSERLCQTVSKGQDCLVHAVTGAGKTEMIYQTIDQVLKTGGACAVVSPRIDVCIELHKRLKRDFSCKVGLLHGHSEPYTRCPLLVATVHQLYRFYQAFDVIIIDEVDAFPFVDDASLYYAVETALALDGVQVFLTATSTDALEAKVKAGQLLQLDLPRRFHGHPLVVPSFSWLNGLEKGVKKGLLPRALVRDIKAQRATGFPLLLFFPHIALGERLAQSLKTALPHQKIGYVSSQEAQRLTVVEAFRSGQLDILVTTTILERGVTFPGVDVFVLWAHHRLYTKSSLVQIAGRVGRSSDRPEGLLRFYHEGKTRAMVRARQAIQEMNAKGGFS
ncbi:DEAD/DEAH box helicase [Streptococcus sp. DD12]|uniref:DEAD/DEAH box helicase n=1 Tax=Streptococcus sp. DD12 TaxID=1777880 RepID=UPI0007967A05|nr:DEAD/DEAH box helicase [Streptococcus sp. DD12]KXT75961.1 ComF operon protein A, DNA transporter ATPase [Streptococcus sp. DD12]